MSTTGTAPQLFPTQIEPGAGGGGLYGGGINPTAVKWAADQQQRYNQVTGLANLLNHVATNPQQYGQDNSNIAGGMYLRFLAEKNPYQAIEKYTQQIQQIMQDHQAGADAASKVQAQNQPPSVVAPQGGAVPPPPGSGAAALPAQPRGQIGPTPTAGQTPPPPGYSGPTGFAAQLEPQIQYQTRLLQAQATAPEQARIAGEQQQYQYWLTQKDPATGQPLFSPQMAAMMSNPYRMASMNGYFNAQVGALKAGYKLDPITNQPVPMTPEELSVQTQAKVALQSAQTEFQKSADELNKAKTAALTDPNNPKLNAEIKRMLALTVIAGQRLQIAQSQLALASGRFDLAQQQFAANYNPYATSTGGQPILSDQDRQNMGLPTDENNQAVGLKSPAAPTVAQRGRRDQANVIQVAGQNLVNAINANRDKFGSMSSILNSAFLGTPLADPASQGLAAQIKSFAALQPALHGFRGQQALNEFLKGIGGLPNNPDALIAGIQQGYMGTAGAVKSAARTTRSSVPPPPGSAPATGGLIYARDANGKLHSAPAGTVLPKGWTPANAPTAQ